MTTIDIENSIVQETRGLSPDTLREILDFIRFLKAKHVQPTPNTENIMAHLPKHRLGKINSALSREEIYADAR